MQRHCVVSYVKVNIVAAGYAQSEQIGIRHFLADAVGAHAAERRHRIQADITRHHRADGRFRRVA